MGCCAWEWEVKIALCNGPSVPCEEGGRDVSQKTRERWGAVRGVRKAAKEGGPLQS